MGKYDFMGIGSKPSSQEEAVDLLRSSGALSTKDSRSAVAAADRTRETVWSEIDNVDQV